MDRVSLQRPILSSTRADRRLEGAGFPVRRPFPSAALDHLDPFLLLDEMGPRAWGPREAIGAPDHPHRGFETVTYLLQGTMQHRDSQGNEGLLKPGDVQWMTAGAGIVHSEMPEEKFFDVGGVLHGFQLWINLPRARKMMAPRYQDIAATRIPVARDEEEGIEVRVIAGTCLGKTAVIDTVLPISYLHLGLQPGASLSQPIPEVQHGFIFVFEGSVEAGTPPTPIPDGVLGRFGPGDEVTIRAGKAGAQALLIAGTPLGEPVARYGPFVMSTRAELEQAFADFQQGRMGSIKATMSHGR